MSIFFRYLRRRGTFCRSGGSGSGSLAGGNPRLDTLHIQRLRIIHAMDRTRRANGLALTAEFTLGIIDVGHIVFENNGIVRTGLGADTATDAGIRTGLLHGRTAVLVLSHAVR